jgi:hypothetical protein
LGGGSSSNSGAPGLDLTGYNYLTKGAGASTITGAQDRGNAAGAGAQASQDQQAELLGTKPVTDQTKTAFNNYLNSTGYNFNMDQGTRAITGSAAARGLLNSGSTAKALTQYGQNLGSSYFNNYLGQVSNLNTQQSNTAGQGINATVSAGSAGTQGGVAAGQNTQSGADTMGGAIATAGGIAAGAINNWLAPKPAPNTGQPSGAANGWN